MSYIPNSKTSEWVFFGLWCFCSGAVSAYRCVEICSLSGWVFVHPGFKFWPDPAWFWCCLAKFCGHPKPHVDFYLLFSFFLPLPGSTRGCESRFLGTLRSPFDLEFRTFESPSSLQFKKAVAAEGSRHHPLQFDMTKWRRGILPSSSLAFRKH